MIRTGARALSISAGLLFVALVVMMTFKRVNGKNRAILTPEKLGGPLYVVYVVTAKRAAIDKIRLQPFFRGDFARP